MTKLFSFKLCKYNLYLSAYVSVSYGFIWCWAQQGTAVAHSFFLPVPAAAAAN